MIEFFSTLFYSMDCWHPLMFLWGFAVGLGVKMNEKRNNSTYNNWEKDWPTF